MKKNEKKFGKVKKSPYLCIGLGIIAQLNNFHKKNNLPPPYLCTIKQTQSINKQNLHKMKTSSLTSKLDKLKVPHTVKHINEHNKSLDFTINGKSFSADFTATSELIHFFSTIVGYDQAEQEHQRLFFYSFASVLRYAN